MGKCGPVATCGLRTVPHPQSSPAKIAIKNLTLLGYTTRAALFSALLPKCRERQRLTGMRPKFLFLAVAIIFLSFKNSAAPSSAPAFEQIHKIDVHAHIFENIPELTEMLRR